MLLLPLLVFIALLTRGSLMGKYATDPAWTVVIVAVTLMIVAATVVLGVVHLGSWTRLRIRASGVVVRIARNLSEIAQHWP